MRRQFVALETSEANACAGIHVTLLLELVQAVAGKDCIGVEHGVALRARVRLGDIAGKELCRRYVCRL